MPFAHCIDCGTSALIDPSGRCPEGHEVGAAGARVASAIGSAGPHPDEPLPWVGTVEIDPAVLDAAPPEPRVARPPSVPTNDLTGGASAVQSAPAAGATDELLRELHALGDFGDVGDAAPPAAPPAAALPAPPAAAAPAPTPAPAPLAPPTRGTSPAAPLPTPITRPAPEAVAPGSPAPPSSPEEATDLDELASLAAAIGSLDDRGAVRFGPTGTAPAAASTPTDALEDLWAAAESAPAAPAAPPPPASLFAPRADIAPPVAERPDVPANPFAPRPDAPTTAFPPTPAATTSPFAPTEELPAPTVAPTTEPFGTPEPAATAVPGPAVASGASAFDGGFTARGDGVGRRTQRRLDAKAAKKGLFRR